MSSSLAIKFDLFDYKLFGKMTIVGQKNIAKGTRSELPVGDATLNIVVRKFNGIMIFGQATHYCQKFVPILLYLGIIT
jgi:hypothetical protein